MRQLLIDLADRDVYGVRNAHNNMTTYLACSEVCDWFVSKWEGLGTDYGVKSTKI